MILILASTVTLCLDSARLNRAACVGTGLGACKDWCGTHCGPRCCASDRWLQEQAFLQEL